MYAEKSIHQPISQRRTIRGKWNEMQYENRNTTDVQVSLALTWSIEMQMAISRDRSISVVAEEGRDPLKFIVFISSTSLDAHKGTEYDNVQKEA